MRRTVLALIGLLAGIPAAGAADCTKDVVDAFQKQRTSKAFRVAMQQPSAEGPVDMTVDYMPPDKMLQTVKSAAMPGDQQTMLVGSRAFSGSNGAFEELLPQHAQSILTEVATALGAPGETLGQFECLGKVTFESQDLAAYRTFDKAQKETDPDKMLGRTIYVDPASGLPAYNVVGTLSGKSEPVLKVVYSYPTDTVIEAPIGAPVRKVH